MADPQSKNLIIITHGVDDGIRQVLFALQYATTLINLNLKTTIFLTGLAVRWSYKDLSYLKGRGDFVKAIDYFAMFTEAGGKVKVCTTCYEGEMFSAIKNKEITDTLIKGAELVGLTEIAEESLDCVVTVF